MTMRAIIVFTGIAATSLGMSCKTTWTSPYSGHCANQNGDDWCAVEYADGSRPFCSRGIDGCEEDMDRVSAARDGCVPSRPAADECYSPCGGRTDVTEDATCVDGVSSTSESETSTGTTMESSASESSESSTTGPLPCMGNDDCTDVTTPFCEPVSGECVSCEETEDPDAACAGLDPLLPLCIGGSCVACTAAAPQACMGQTPVCDDATNTCVPCTVHDQCGEAACNLYTGACLPAGAVVHVGPGQAYAELAAAVASFAAGAEGTIIVHQDDYNETVTENAGRTLAFLAADGELPLWILAGGGMPQLTVSAGSTVLMDGIRLSSNANDVGLRVDGGRAWVDRSRIVQNSGGGVLAENGAELTLRNCFVGGASPDVDAVAIDGSALDMLYTTVGGGTVLGGRARALYCAGGTSVEVRNSILVSADPMPELECASAALTTSVTETEIGNLNIMWFTGYATGDFSLTAMGAPIFADVAEWSTGDPLTDIDGDPRPAVDGSPDYAGADVP